MNHSKTTDGRAAVFLDRDGTLNEAAPDPDTGLPESPLQVSDVRLIPGAAPAARSLAQAGFALVCVTNQPAAAKGKIPRAQLLAVHDRVLELLREQGVEFDASRICLHHPHGVVPELTGPCACRKPAPGMLLDAARELGIDLAASWMIGDTDADVTAGWAAGCRTLLVEYPPSAHKRGREGEGGGGGEADPDLRAPTLADGVAPLLEQHAARPRPL